MRKLCKQIESRINIGSENLSNEQNIRFSNINTQRSSHAIDKGIEVKKLLYKLINNVCVIIVIYFEYFVDPKGLLSSIVVIYPSPDVKKHLSLIIFHWGKIHLQCGG